MFWFIAKRLLEFIPVLLIIVTVTFFLIRLAPGGPFDMDQASASPQIRERLEAAYNLDAPLWRQYLDYVGGLLQGDMGPSFTKINYSVGELIWMKLPVSLELGLYALLVALIIGLSAGLLASLKPNSWLDQGPMAFAMTGICVPNIVLGPLLVLIFALWLDWLPVQGWRTPAHKVLPAITLGAAYAAYIACLTRGGMLEMLSQDFIRTARAKGLSEARVVLLHGLRGGVQPVVAFLGPAAAGMLTGSFVVETIFKVPGLGQEFVRAAFDRDYTLILGTVLVYAVLVLFLNLVADILNGLLDPRVRQS